MNKNILISLAILVPTLMIASNITAYPRLTEFPAPFVQEGKIDYDLNGVNDIAIMITQITITNTPR